VSSDNTLKWFDGYDGQPVTIIDDFRSKGVRFSFVLRLLDRYPLSVEFKGGFVNWAPRYIFITTPNDVAGTFAARKEHLPEDIAQLERRITKVFSFPEEVDDFTMYFSGLDGQLRPEFRPVVTPPPPRHPANPEAEHPEDLEESEEFNEQDFLN